MGLLDKEEKEKIAKLYGLYTIAKGSDSEQIAMFENLNKEAQENMNVMKHGVNAVVDLVPDAMANIAIEENKIKQIKSIAESFARNYEAQFGKWEGGGTFGGSSLVDAAYQFIRNNDPGLKMQLPLLEKDFMSKTINAVGESETAYSTKPQFNIPPGVSEGVYQRRFGDPTARDVIEKAAESGRLNITDPSFPTLPGAAPVERSLTGEEIITALEHQMNPTVVPLVPESNYIYTFTESVKQTEVFTAGVERAVKRSTENVSNLLGGTYDSQYGGIKYANAKMDPISKGAVNYSTNYLETAPGIRGPEGKEILRGHPTYAGSAGVIHSVLGHYIQANSYESGGKNKGRVAGSPLTVIANNAAMDELQNEIVDFMVTGDYPKIADSIVALLHNPHTNKGFASWDEFDKTMPAREVLNLKAKLEALEYRADKELGVSSTPPASTTGGRQQDHSKWYGPITNVRSGPWLDPDGKYYDSEKGGNIVKPYD